MIGAEPGVEQAESIVAYNLTGYNIINGTAAGESLVGTALNDAIYGNGGADTLTGGQGADILFGGAGGGVTFLYNPDSTWTAGYSSYNAGDPSGAGSGALFDLNGYGQSYDVFVGSGSNNTLVMPDGKNALFLDDGLSRGADSIRLVNIQTIKAGAGGQLIDLTSFTASYGDVTIIGGSGDDILMSSNGNDVVTGGDGNDYVWGGSGNDALSGGAGSDKLLGATGNDSLDGGTGADVMSGGAGDDTYTVDDAGDVVNEDAGQGLDRVISAISNVLAANVEQLTLVGSATNGTGNALDNTLTGNALDNVLDGGAGADTMIGDAGNDTYVVDNAGDAVVEGVGQGTDLVLSSVSHTLADNVEKLTLTGTSAINGTGNVLDNVITGNSAANVLDGGLGNDTIDGGAGGDTMMGGAGNDTYVVDNSGDQIVETAGQGTDLVLSQITYALQSNIENLTMTGTSAIDGTGNALNNLIVGSSASNTLSGLDGDDKINGGLGNDTLNGGNGKDQLFGEDGNDTLYGGDGDDGLNGGAGTDTLKGGNGNDGMFGGGANDALYGEAGNDKIYGDGGNDFISGGAGNDLLAGGQFQNGFSVGNDTFGWVKADVVDGAGVVQGFDHIVDFGAGDKVDFTGLQLAAGPIANVVKVVDTAAGTVISANFGGAAGFIDVVVLDNYHGHTLADMVQDGAIAV